MKIKELSNIDTSTDEGKLLMAALSILTSTGPLTIMGEYVNGRGTEPDKMVKHLIEVSSKMY